MGYRFWGRVGGVRFGDSRDSGWLAVFCSGLVFFSFVDF